MPLGILIWKWLALRQIGLPSVPRFGRRGDTNSTLRPLVGEGESGCGGEGGTENKHGMYI